jgi:hypothetical protein
VTNNLIPETLKIGPYSGKEEWKELVMKKGEAADIVCKNLSYSASDGIIQVDEVTTFPNTYFGKNGETKMYVVASKGFRFLVHPETNEIFETSAYDGALIGPIGTLQ